MDLPISCHVSKASIEKPYIAILLDLDKSMISELLIEIGDRKVPANTSQNRAVSTTASPELANAFLRLIELFHNFESDQVMKNIVLCEIHYLILLSPLGRFVQELYQKKGTGSRISLAVNSLRKNFNTPLDIGNIAKQVGMAQTTFFRHFKKITGMSPLQYQKQLRLFEARRLMLFENESVANASYAVGYESPSQFSREYKRFFGKTPHRDSIQSC